MTEGPFTNPATRYLAMLKAAREFGLAHTDIQSIVRRFPTPAPSEELAAALAEAITREWAI
ncbi:MAG: hypothetical protein ACXVRH_01360 [Thermoleophilaceae bacterium]